MPTTVISMEVPKSVHRAPRPSNGAADPLRLQAQENRLWGRFTKAFQLPEASCLND